MTWTDEELLSLYDNVYARRFVCPACGGALLRAHDGTNAMGVIQCVTCDRRHLVSPEQDPLRARFRPYTEAERREVIAAEKARRTPRCPIDGTEMDVQLQRSLGRNSNVLIRCPRCAARTEYVRMHG